MASDADTTSLLQTLTSAVIDIHNDATDSAQRQRAQQTCETLLTHPRALWLSFHLLHSRHAAPVRFFGLHTLLRLLDVEGPQGWRALGTPQRAQVRSSALAFVAQGLSATDPPYLHEKAVALLVELAKREWHPAHHGGESEAWTTLVSDIRSLATSVPDALHATLALRFWRALIQDVYEFPQRVVSSRVAQLARALEDAQGEVLALVHSLAAAAHARVNDAQCSAAERLEAQRMLVAALETLAAAAGWCNLPLLEERGWWPVLCALLSDSRARHSAVQCLDALLERRERHVDDERRLFFAFDHCAALVASLRVSSGDLDDDYVFQKALVRVLAQLGERHVRMLERTLQRTEARVAVTWPGAYATFVELLLTCTRVPSLTLLSDVLPYWTLLLRFAREHAQHANAAAWIEPVCTQLSAALAGKARKERRLAHLPATLPTDERGRLRYYLSVDCESAREVKALHAHIGALLAATWRALMRVAPHIPLQLLNVRLQQCAPLLSVLDDGGVRAALVEWSALGSELSACMREVSAVQLASDATLRGLSESLLHALLQLRPVHASLAVEHVRALVTFGAVYATQPAALDVALRELVARLAFVSPEEQRRGGGVYALSAATLELRRRAQHALIALCHGHPALMAPRLADLTRFADTLLSGDTLLPSEQVAVLEALVCASTSLPSASEQAEYLSVILAAPLRAWQELRVAISAPLKLLEHFGLQSRGKVDDDSAQRRLRFYSAVHALSAVNRRVKETRVLSVFDDALVDSVAALVGTLHALWLPMVRSHVPKELHALFSVSDATRRTLLGQDDAFGLHENEDLEDEDEAHESNGQAAGGATHLAPLTGASLRDLVGNVRIFSYELLGSFASRGALWRVSDARALLERSAFAHWEHIEVRHLALLLRLVVRPLSVALQDAGEQGPRVLALALEALSASTELVLREWRRLPAASTQDEASTVVAEKFLRDASQELVSVCSALLLTSGSSAPRQLSSAARFLCEQQPTALASVLAALSSLLSVRDSSTFGACCALLEDAVTLMPSLVPPLAPALMNALLAALQLGQHDVEHARAVAVLAGLVPLAEDAFASAARHAGATQAQLQALARDMRAARSDKARRNVLRGFISDVMRLAPLRAAASVKRTKGGPRASTRRQEKEDARMSDDEGDNGQEGLQSLFRRR